MKIYICVCLVLMALALNTEMADGLKQDTGPKFDSLFRRPRRTSNDSPIDDDTGSDPDNDDDDVIENPGDDDNNGNSKCFDKSKDCSMEFCEHHTRRAKTLCRKYCGYCY